MNIEEWMWLVWLILMVVAFVIEAASEALVSLWFAAGALVALGLSFIPGLAFYWEILAFLAVSTAAFFLIRPLFTKLLKKRIVKTNVDSLVGAKAIVKSEGDSLHPGEVVLRGSVWTALPIRDGVCFTKGEIVKVLAVEGNKLLVDIIEKENSQQ
ncbi:MAG: NfeD family protein [Candidatus Enteromonas sp.]|nr:NfeD family protein [Candidatus Enteromonas sp.]